MSIATPLLFIAMPSAETVEALLQAFDTTGLRPSLGDALFPPSCWHQSLSNRFPDTPEMVSALMAVGSQVSATPFQLTINRLRGEQGQSPLHWSLRYAGAARGLIAVQQAIRSGLLAQEIEVETGNTPHITISYRAPTALPTTFIPPVLWKVDEFLLVRRGGDPYRYRPIARWPLLGRPESAGPQLQLL